MVTNHAIDSNNTGKRHHGPHSIRSRRQNPNGTKGSHGTHSITSHPKAISRSQPRRIAHTVKRRNTFMSTHRLRDRSCITRALRRAANALKIVSHPGIISFARQTGRHGHTNVHIVTLQIMTVMADITILVKLM